MPNFIIAETDESLHQTLTLGQQADCESPKSQSLIIGINTLKVLLILWGKGAASCSVDRGLSVKRRVRAVALLQKVINVVFAMMFLSTITEVDKSIGWLTFFGGNLSGFTLTQLNCMPILFSQ